MVGIISARCSKQCTRLRAGNTLSNAQFRNPLETLCARWRTFCSHATPARTRLVSAVSSRGRPGLSGDVFQQARMEIPPSLHPKWMAYSSELSPLPELRVEMCFNGTVLCSFAVDAAAAATSDAACIMGKELRCEVSGGQCLFICILIFLSHK